MEELKRMEPFEDTPLDIDTRKFLYLCRLPDSEASSNEKQLVPRDNRWVRWMKMVTKNTIASSIKYMDEYIKDWVDEFIDRMAEHDQALWDKNCSIDLTNFHKLLEDSSQRQKAKYGHKRHEKLLEDMDR